MHRTRLRGCVTELKAIFRTLGTAKIVSRFKTTLVFERPDFRHPLYISKQHHRICMSCLKNQLVRLDCYIKAIIFFQNVKRPLPKLNAENHCLSYPILDKLTHLKQNYPGNDVKQISKTICSLSSSWPMK